MQLKRFYVWKAFCPVKLFCITMGGKKKYCKKDRWVYDCNNCINVTSQYRNMLKMNCIETSIRELGGQEKFIKGETPLTSYWVSAQDGRQTAGLFPCTDDVFADIKRTDEASQDDPPWQQGWGPVPQQWESLYKVRDFDLQRATEALACRIYFMSQAGNSFGKYLKDHMVAKIR